MKPSHSACRLPTDFPVPPPGRKRSPSWEPGALPYAHLALPGRKGHEEDLGQGLKGKGSGEGDRESSQQSSPAQMPSPVSLPTDIQLIFQKKIHMPPPPGSLLWFLPTRINHLFIIPPRTIVYGLVLHCNIVIFVSMLGPPIGQQSIEVSDCILIVLFPSSHLHIFFLFPLSRSLSLSPHPSLSLPVCFLSPSPCLCLCHTQQGLYPELSERACK